MIQQQPGRMSMDVLGIYQTSVSQSLIHDEVLHLFYIASSLSSSPHFGIVPVEYTSKTILLKIRLSWSILQKRLPICRPASAWRTLWSVQSEGKLLYTPSSANLNIWLSSAFSPRWEKNKAARSRTTIPRLECNSQVNWIMGFFVCFGLTQFAFNFYCSL